MYSFDDSDNYSKSFSQNTGKVGIFVLLYTEEQNK